MSLIGIGVNGLNVSQTSLTVTGNNISNATVEGYSRQRAELVTRPEQFRGGSYIGAGSAVEAVNRLTDSFLVSQVRLDSSVFSELNNYLTNIEQLDTLLADEFSSLSPSLDNLFTSLEEGAEDPTSIPTRQLVLSNTQGLVEQFHTLYDRLAQQNNGVNEQLLALTSQASSIAEGIAELNKAIVTATGVGGNPNQLMDRRDLLVLNLSEIVGVRVTTDKNGSINVFIGNGQPLVTGTISYKLDALPSVDDSSRFAINYIALTGPQEISSLISGGGIGGLLSFRDDMLDEAFNGLGRIAIGLGDRLNEFQQRGMDLEGNFGQNLFLDVNDANLMANRVVDKATNIGTASLSVGIEDIDQLTISNYSFVITGSLVAASPSYVPATLTRGSDGLVIQGRFTDPDTDGDDNPLTNPGAIFVPNDPDGAGPLTATDIDQGIAINVDNITLLQVDDSFQVYPTRSAALDANLGISRPQELAYALPFRTESLIGNTGTGEISPGIVLSSDQASWPFIPVNITVDANNLLVVTDKTGAAVPIEATSVAFIPGRKNTVTFGMFGASPGTFGYRLDVDPVLSDSADIFRMELTGTPLPGDEFDIVVNDQGSSDNRNAVAMGLLRVEGSFDNGSLNFEDAYGQLVERIGVETAQTIIRRDSSESLLFQSTQQHQQVSGVNLDEEAANLIKFEQAYSASAQVVNVAREIFDTLLAAFR